MQPQRYCRTPRLVAVTRRGGDTLVVGHSTRAAVRAGWDTLVRRGHKVLATIALDVRQVDDNVEISSVELRGIQAYLVGDWLTNSNSVRRHDARLRRLAGATWAAWLARAFYGSWFARYAVVWTIVRFMHVDRRRSRGMVPLSPLYDALPRFLALYTDGELNLTNGVLLESVRALIQLRDRHYWSRTAVRAAEEALAEKNDDMYPEIAALVDEARVEPRAARFYLGTSFNGVAAHHIVYEFILHISTEMPELAATIFAGVSLYRPATRPRRIHGKWTGSPPPRYGGGSKLFALLHTLEFNAFLKRDDRYKMCPYNMHNTKPHHARTENVWVTRKLT